MRKDVEPRGAGDGPRNDPNPDDWPRPSQAGPRVGSTTVADVLARVRAIPEGFVRAYGDICPGAPRFAGAVLAGTDEPGLPWHRIVRADGTLAQGARQRALLEAEGIPFVGERVDMRVARLPD